MAVVCSGEVTQSGDAKTLTFTDTGTGYVNVTSRQLNIFDAYGALVNSINMGASLTAQQSITKDVWYSFILIVTDENGTYSPPYPINYRSQQFYNLAQVQWTMADTDCGCTDNPLCSLPAKADQAIDSSLTFFNIGDSVSCQAMLDAANFLINKAIYGP